MPDCGREVEFAERLTKNEALSKSNKHRIEDVEKRQDALDALTASMARMDERQERMDGDVKEIKADVKTITQKSGKRWDGIVDKLLWLVIGAAVAALFAQVGIAV